ncbi:hypothetical protein DAI22_02g187601 [Oryza sativa Japonica Group]|nr:hypothetical protein DAI22_02g187601 [Oryza sativa Japonica Group]
MAGSTTVVAVMGPHHVVIVNSQIRKGQPAHNAATVFHPSSPEEVETLPPPVGGGGKPATAESTLLRRRWLKTTAMPTYLPSCLSPPFLP